MNRSGSFEASVLATVGIFSSLRPKSYEIVKIDAPVALSFPLGEDSVQISAEEIASRPLEPARVKWFDKGKGFGFANVFGDTEDVFIHVEVLRVSGFADLQPGEAVCLRITNGKRGRMALQVMSWEAAAREGG